MLFKSLASFINYHPFTMLDGATAPYPAFSFERMKINTSILFSTLMFYSLLLPAQKEDNTWLLGGVASPDSAYKTCKLEFLEDQIAITYIDKNLPFRGVNVSISDSLGGLLCFTNGKNLFNRAFEIMEGGVNFYPNAEFPSGVSYIQGYTLLPYPDGYNKVAYIYGTPKVVEAPVPGGYTVGYINLKYAIADLNQNGGLGLVTQRDITVSTDTLMPTQFTAIRHGNGRDWWLLAPYHLGNRFYRFLLDSDGLHQVGKQDISTTDLGLGHTCFSPDGQWYARFNWPGVVPDSSFSVIELYRFDRCSGLLSDRVSKTYDLSGLNGKPGGTAFSPNSRFLYVTRWDSVFQYDLHATDIIASEQVVAVYDGFIAEPGFPTRFFYPLLAPDNKIYICVSNYNSPFLHTIENPDEPGLACNVQQHSVRLPVFNNFLLPNMPYYRLWEWEDSPCDTLGSVAVKEVSPEKNTGFTVYPNPAGTVVNIAFAQPIATECTLSLISPTGQVLYSQTVGAGGSSLSLPVHQFANGFYYLRLRSDRQPDAYQKLSIVH